jgi:RNA 2',3'-cyclic 3'-phosphodiesterase
MNAPAGMVVSPEAAHRRLFLALWPEASVRAQLGASFAATTAGAGGQAVAAANLHVTIEFLGAVAEHRVAELELLGARTQLPVDDLVLDTLEWWPRPALLVAGSSAPSQALLDLQAQLRRQLALQGFRVDARAFRPHLTLARRVATVPDIKAVSPVRWPIRELALVESLPFAGGSRYAPLARWTR